VAERRVYYFLLGTLPPFDHKTPLTTAPILFSVACAARVPAVLTGSTGTGKTVLIRQLLARGVSPDCMTLWINFSATTTPAATHALIDRKVRARLTDPELSECRRNGQPAGVPPSQHYPFSAQRAWLKNHCAFHRLSTLQVGGGRGGRDVYFSPSS